ncbi:roadblock/LC7 domain-containing protein [Planosporangium mesophilum]|uniref:Dynein regulation protein LC7 n=1 Tax=Planosporangium mesophilum TaxID=689768 RepID=A0A8J3TCW5_9ACTN|nr:roadblock/LC7 domain-containing protein [Planosporangium mesophilum]NJC86692.1 roadblock/LC7 domain-containing protein [Planosporangium mesophilum]GII24118.1 dynein regulation protein LC7 [Planosporangium mesophilum]
MPSDGALDEATNLTWLLSGLVHRVPHTRSALLLSSDGLRRAAHGLDADSADQLAAIASGLFSLAHSAGHRFGGGDGVRQVVAELDDTLLFVSTAGSSAVLAVLASRGVDVGVLGYEMSRLVTSVRPYLATPARQSTSTPDRAGS